MHEIVVIKAHYYPKGARFGTVLELADLVDDSLRPFLVDGKVVKNGLEYYKLGNLNPDEVFEPIDESKHPQEWVGDTDDDTWADDEILRTKQDFVYFEFAPITDNSPYTDNGKPLMKAMLEWRDEFDLYADNILEIWEHIYKRIAKHYGLLYGETNIDGYGYDWTVLTLWNAYIHCNEDYEGYSDCDDEWGYVGILSTEKLVKAVVSPDEPGICEIPSCRSVGTSRIDGKWYCEYHAKEKVANQ